MSGGPMSGVPAVVGKIASAIPDKPTPVDSERQRLAELGRRIAAQQEREAERRISDSYRMGAAEWRP